MMSGAARVSSALLIAAGLVLAGWFVGNGFVVGRSADRYVTVKGVAEREVEANIAIWPLTVVVSGNELAATHAELKRSIAALHQFFADNGVTAAEIHFQGFSVTDTYADRYGSNQGSGNRYVINQTLIVRSEDPAKVLAASARVADLVAVGVVLQSGNAYQSGGPSFLFTDLNTHKPAMIAEATARAREAAEEFARDSGAALGGIRRANQGVFQILPRDQVAAIAEEQQISKIVRVVTTVEYALHD
jgi:hypothetical protein